MNFFISTKKSIPALNRTIPDWDSLRRRGINYYLSCDDDWDCPLGLSPDVIICMGIGGMGITESMLERFPETPLFVYHWDCYEWVWKNPRPGEYDYRRYGELLKKAKEVWVPSYCTGERAIQWWPELNGKMARILSSVPYFDAGTKDGEYLLCTLREIPDPFWGEFERTCEELRIPYRMTNHEASRQEYEEAVANCRGIVSPLWELSTGGLSCLEAYYLGKPVLLSNSRWHGGKDYFSDRALYFDHHDRQDFMRKLLIMYTAPPIVPEDHSDWVRYEFSSTVMVSRMVSRIQIVINSTPIKSNHD